MSAGGLHSCGVTESAQVYCWGFGANGQLGNGATGERRGPVAVRGGLAFRQVSAGNAFTCALTTGDRAYCWGFNGNGQLGDGTRTSRLTPVAVAGNHRFRQLSAGDAHVCAGTADLQVFCWGFLGTDLPVALGDGSSVGSAIPVRVAGDLPLRQVSAGTDHTCAVTTSEQAFCWGANGFGQIGDGIHSADPRLRPSRVAGERSFTQVDAGVFHSCAVTPGQRAFCWGDNRAGQLGDGTQSGRYAPRAVVGSIALERVSAARQYSCAEGAENRTWCWGSNASGQLGNGSGVGLSVRPVLVGGGHFFNQVSAGYFHVCARTGVGEAFCWGTNGNGQLGNGSFSGFEPLPVAVVAPR